MTHGTYVWNHCCKVYICIFKFFNILLIYIEPIKPFFCHQHHNELEGDQLNFCFQHHRLYFRSFQHSVKENGGTILTSTEVML